MKRLAVLGHPVSSRSPAMQTGGSRRSDWRANGATRRSTCHRRSSRPRRRRFPSRGSSAPTSRSATSRPRSRSRTRPPTRPGGSGPPARSASALAGSAPTTPTPPACWRRSRSRWRGARRSPGGRRVGTPRSGCWPSKAPRSRSGTARRRGRRGWSVISPAPGRTPPSDGRLPVSGEQALANAYELIINCTAIGMRDEDPFEHLPLDPERWNAEIVLVDLVYSGSESGLIAEARGGGAPRRSTDWRSWSARAGSRCESGRVWIHRWRSCARQRSEQGSPDFRRAQAHAYRATR